MVFFNIFEESSRNILTSDFLDLSDSNKKKNPICFTTNLHDHSFKLFLTRNFFTPEN